MPPCHGGDRRFESGQIRHKKCLSRKTGVFLMGKLACDSNRIRQSRGSQTSRSPEFTRRADLFLSHPVEPSSISTTEEPLIWRFFLV